MNFTLKKAWMGLEPQPYRLTVILLYQLSYQVRFTPSKWIPLREAWTPNLSPITGVLLPIELSRVLVDLGFEPKILDDEPNVIPIVTSPEKCSPATGSLRLPC